MGQAGTRGGYPRNYRRNSQPVSAHRGGGLMCAVYIIRCGVSGPVKIGHASNPQQRLADLQVGSWEILRIIRLFKGSFPEEAALHAKFSDLYIRGEWFHFSRLMMGNVGLAQIYIEPYQAKP